MHYVGLSRVRNSSSLHVLILNEKKIKISEKVKNEMSRLRREASLKPLAVLQVNLDSPQTKTVLSQTLSLHLHIHDVQTDYNIQKADFNIFVETKLCLSDRDDSHMSYLDLLFTEMTSISLSSGLLLELLCILKII